MMSLAEINRANREATKQAVRNGKHPAVPTAEQRACFATGELSAPGFKIPNLGCCIPEGWTLTDVDPFFVDTSGFGREGEPALTQRQFALKLAELPEGDGVGLTEAGQFQAHVAVYRRMKPTRNINPGLRRVSA